MTQTPTQTQTQPSVNASILVDWSTAYAMALHTVGKHTDATPSDTWVSRMLLAEHSPIRATQYIIEIDSVRQWVTVHLVRHHIGLEKFVRTQRPDRRTLDTTRDELPQGSLNDMTLIANAQALINISRKRLCAQASPETRECWTRVLEAVRQVDPLMAAAMVPECVYRGFCPELKPCGYTKTHKYLAALGDYRSPAASQKYTPAQALIATTQCPDTQTPE